MTDEELFLAMDGTPEFLSSLKEQIGEITHREIDRVNGKIHFYGSTVNGHRKNCTFALQMVESSLVEQKEKVCQMKFL